MRRLAGLVLTALLGGLVAARAQSAQEPNLVLSIIGGVTTGGDLWTIPRQLVQGPNGHDTLALGRRLRPGVSAGLGAAYFRSPHLGYALEVGYFGLASEARCTPIGGFRFDPEGRNEQACTAAQGGHIATSVVGFQAGLAYHVVAGGPVIPYLRATGGIGALGASYVETSAVISASSCPSSSTCQYVLLFDGARKRAILIGTLAAGLTLSIGPGYRLRLEVRDFVARLPVAGDSVGLGSPPPFPTARGAFRTRHVPAVTVGLDVVLERRHRRRY